MTIAGPPTDGVRYGDAAPPLIRLIVSPACGVLKLMAAVRPEARVIRGHTLGFVDNRGTLEFVRSAFEGTVVSMLAATGDRVRAGQPVACLGPPKREGSSVRTR